MYVTTNIFIMIKITKEEMEELINSSTTMGEAFSKCAKIKNFQTFRKYAKTFDLWKPNIGRIGLSKPWLVPSFELEDILSGKWPHYSTRKLSKRLVAAGVLTNKCAACGAGDTWNNKPLTLQLDHINGVSTDHRLENLQLLCPNCHTQTETYGSKNIKSRGKSA